MNSFSLFVYTSIYRYIACLFDGLKTIERKKKRSFLLKEKSFFSLGKKFSFLQNYNILNSYLVKSLAAAVFIE